MANSGSSPLAQPFSPDRQSDSRFVEQVTLGLTSLATAVPLWWVPSWEGWPVDPCRVALIASAVTILLLYVTRVVGVRGLFAERVVLALFLAGMPVIYLARAAMENGGRSGLLVETVGLMIYGTASLAGFRRFPWLLPAGIAAHGFAWDSWHVQSAYIPAWYAYGCLVVDVGIGAYAAARVPAWKASLRTAS